jgi:ABC-2 type transport system permease protein
MRSIWTLALKDLRLLLRDRLAVFWVVGFPLLMAFLFGAMFGGGGGDDDDDDGDATPGIAIALVDAEGSPESKAFAAKLEASKDLAVARAVDVAAAKKAVLANDAAAYVVLVGDFAGPGMLGGKPPRVEIGAAPTRRAESGMLRGIVMQEAAELLRSTLAGFTGAGGGAGPLTPVAIDAVEVSAKSEAGARPRPASNWEVTFPSSILWGLIACAATFALSLVSERQSGTFYRLKTAPLTRTQILAGKGLACLTACAAVLALLLAVGVFVMGVRVQSATGLVVAALCCALCFTGLMMLLSTLGRTEQAAAGTGWGIMTVMAMLGGGMFPLFLMPAWMQTASNVSPVKWGILALEGSIWRGFTLSQMALPCGVLVGVGLAGFVGGAAILSRRDR